MDVERLIALVKEQPALYDGSYLRHRDREALSAIWKSIASQLNCDEDEIRDKWHNLRSNYRRAKKKEKLRSQGSAPGSYRKWAHYDLMSFLYPYTENGMSSNVPEKSQDICISTIEDNSDSEAHAAVMTLELDGSAHCDTTEENMPVITVEEQPCDTIRINLESNINNDHQYFAEAGNTDPENIDEGISDKMFLLSLLPFIKQLDPADNLDFRMEVQQILRRKLYPPMD